MRIFFLFAIFFAAANPIGAQALRSSFFQYQFNQLSLNPAYASRLPVTGIEATYFGNFASANQVSRSVLLNVQSPTVAGGVGGTFQFYRTFFFGELNLRPAFAYRIRLPNEGEISFGAAVGLNYFDIDESVVSSVQRDFLSIDGGAGVFYHRNRTFGGLSVLNLFEATFGLDGGMSGNELFRENTFNLHFGTAFRFLDDIDLKPSALLRYINVYALPDDSPGSLAQQFSFDLQLSAFVQENYVVSLVYGETEEGLDFGTTRFGISLSYLLGNLRLGYAVQVNTQKGTSVSLPSSHLLNIGYDLSTEREGAVVRYF